MADGTCWDEYIFKNNCKGWIFSGEFYLLDYLGIYTPEEIFSLPNNLQYKGKDHK